jgi:Zn-dependent protease with chaperone function
VEKGDVLGFVGGLVLFSILVYVPAGIYVSRRSRRYGFRSDSALHRATVRSGWALFAGCLVFFLFVADSRERLGPVLTSVLLYLVPVFWLVAGVLGASRLELRSRGLSSGLFRFARFNLFTAFLMGGQALPLLSAAFAAPVDVSAGLGILPGLLLHAAIAIGMGLLLRYLIVGRMIETRSFPDREVVERLEAVAREARIRFKSLVLVPHERGQSVNAVAATSSGTIYVAEGLHRGLDREELVAVLLHELGHFAQPLTVQFRNLSSLGVPVAVWFLRARAVASPDDVLLSVLFVIGLLVVGSLLVRFVEKRSEIEADRFAASRGEPGALVSALRKLYAENPPRRRLLESRGSTHPALSKRIALLSD